MTAPPTEFRITIAEKASYLHVTAEGPRTPENAQRVLREAYEACVKAGKSALLLELNFSGPSLSPLDIYRVITGGAADGSRLRRIAYVQAEAPDPTAPRFAETVATNRGVNVRLFRDVASASEWLAE